MIRHFGLSILDTKIGHRLTRENYVVVNPHGSFGGDITYDLETCREHAINCLINFDINMTYFNSLKKDRFKKAIDRFLEKNPSFIPVIILNDYKDKSGYYLMVLDDYCQAYVGTSKDIYKRIYTHWHTRKAFDRLIFGGVENSIISIDSFRALDTTRLYVSVISETYVHENRLINTILKKYLCNRTNGGLLEGGLQEAIEKRKTREFIASIPKTDITIRYSENLDPTPCQLHEIYMYAANNGFNMNTNLELVESDVVDYICDLKYGSYSISTNRILKTYTVTNISKL